MDPNRPPPVEPIDPAVLLLGALAWVCADDARGQRLLDLTGLDAAELRARATDPAILAATGDFLCSHEPDLIASAEALDCTPADIVAATRRFAQG
jgi:Protein of unknown function (DUF3572)